MYSSGYAKYSPPAKKAMQYHSKGKSCGYYMRIIFFFSSLIQSLIIVSLVLFLIYGKKQDSASTSRIQDLEESFSRLSIENVNLRLQRKNLTTLLNSTVTKKALIEWKLAECRYYGNISLILIPELEKKNQQCMSELFMSKAMARTSGACPPFTSNCNCGPLANELKARLALVEANFTQTTQWMRTEKDQITRERDNLHLEVIRLRRDKITHEREVQMYRQRCKEDFVLSLSGVSNVTRAFLEKIDTLFPNHLAFQLTCPRQREHLDQIRNNCTSLSREVEEKFQRYLNDVGLQVSNILGENSRLKAENQRLYEDYRWCSRNRTEMIQQHKRDQDLLLQMHDEKKAKILEEKIRLSGDIDVLNSNINYKNKEVEHLKDQLKQLNMSCMARAGTFPGLPNSRTGNPGWGSSSPGSVDLGRTGLGMNLGSAYNKPASTGLGSSSSLFPGGSSSSMGSAFNKPAATGTGSSLFGGGSSSSSGSAFGRPASTGTGSSSSSIFGGGSSSSTGSAFSKPASTGTGSSSTSLFGGGSSSSTGSAFSKPASTGTGSSSTSLFGGGSSSSTGSAVNKPASTGTGSSSSSFSGASSSSTGSGLNRFGSTGTGSSSSSLFNSGSSSSTGSGLSKSGSTYGSAGSNPSSSGTGLNKPAQTGRGSSTSASSTGSAGSSSFFGSSSSSSNKPAPNAKTSTGFGSSSTSTAKGSSSSGFSSWFGNTNSGLSKTGSGTGKGPSNGNGFGGTGSSNGGGRTNGPAGGPVSVAQHLQDLQRFIYPPGPEEKQDLSRMLG